MFSMNCPFNDKSITYLYLGRKCSQWTVPLTTKALLTYTWGENVPWEEDEWLKVGFALDRSEEACRSAHWLHLKTQETTTFRMYRKPLRGFQKWTESEWLSSDFKNYTDKCCGVLIFLKNIQLGLLFTKSKTLDQRNRLRLQEKFYTFLSLMHMKFVIAKLTTSRTMREMGGTVLEYRNRLDAFFSIITYQLCHETICQT